MDAGLALLYKEGMRRVILILIGSALLAAGPAVGGNINVGLALHSGGLSLQAPPARAVSGRSVQVPLTIADARGTGAGWTLGLDVSAPVTITSITAHCAAGSTCTLPRVADTGGILQAARDSGMGVIHLVVTVAPLHSGSTGVPLAFSVS
jgi:hypothetical protein